MTVVSTRSDIILIIEQKYFILPANPSYAMNKYNVIMAANSKKVSWK